MGPLSLFEHHLYGIYMKFKMAATAILNLKISIVLTDFEILFSTLYKCTKNGIYMTILDIIICYF